MNYRNNSKVLAEGDCVFPVSSGNRKRNIYKILLAAPKLIERRLVDPVHINTLIFHESEAFICKAFQDEAIVNYASPSITQQMEASGSPFG